MKFKKLAALTLAGAMALSLTACGGGASSSGAASSWLTRARSSTVCPSAATAPR